MVRFFTLLFFSVSVFAAYAPTANAAAPDKSVKALYTEYRKALGDKDYTNAYFFADQAWKAAEEKYGDSKQTGDLAYNYAVLGKTIKNNKRDKRIEKAFNRSIELAAQHGDKADKISMKRHLSYGAYLMQVGKRKKAAPLLVKSDALAQSLGLLHTKDYAKLMYYQAELAYKAKRYDDAQSYIDKAVNTYEGIEKQNTKNAFTALYLQARTNEKTGNWQDALRAYQKIYVNNDRVLDPKNKMIGRAYLRRGQLWRRITKENDLSWDDMQAYSSCPGCWPNILPKFQKRLAEQDGGENFRRERHPPVMPKDALSSAFLAIKYDIDDKGVPTNLRIIGGSHAKTFDAATFASIKTWRAYDRESGDIVTNKKDWVTRMNFRLTNRRGEILDFYGLPLKD